MEGAAESRRVHAAAVSPQRGSASSSSSLGADLDAQVRLAVDPVAGRVEVPYDLVGEHVVVDGVVFAVEAAARSPALRPSVPEMLPRRRRSNNVTSRLVAGARVGEAADPAHADLGNEVARRRRGRPAIAAEIREIDWRLGRGTRRRARSRGADVATTAGHEGSAVNLTRSPPAAAQERGVELRGELVLAGKDADLRAFGLIGWRKPHASAPEQDDGGRTIRDSATNAAPHASGS